jgi:hypothetical protein
LAPANWQADSKAFAALMRHIREIDGAGHTVLMMQVENEAGLRNGPRDCTEAGKAAFAAPIPKELSAYLEKNKDVLVPEIRGRWQAAGEKTSGAWESVFGAGPETDQFFMAWNYAAISTTWPRPVKPNIPSRCT